jgi:hypothetical protein
MTALPEPAGFAVRRVLVAFGASTASGGALEAAVEFAARLGAELEALFVEDVDLLRLAELPFVRQVSLHAGAGRPLSRVELESELRALARQAERRLTEAATRRHMRFSFRTARGQIAAEVSAAAEAADLLILESLSRPFGREARIELPVRALVARVGRSVLLVPPQRAPAGPVHGLIEAGAGGLRALRVAAELAGRYASPLVVTVRAADAAGRRQLIEQSAAAMPAPPARIEFRTMAEAGAAELDALLAAVASGTLVLDAASTLLASDPAWERIAKAPCTVLLLR